MKKSQLKSLIKEILAQHPVHKSINDKLLKIGKQGVEAEKRENYRDKEQKKEVKENVFTSKTNIWSKSPIQDLLNANIYPDGTIGLQVYVPKQTRPVLQSKAVPKQYFTEEYVKQQVLTVYTQLTEKFEQGIADFVKSVQNLDA